MAKRMILMLVIMAALLGGLGFVKYKQVEAAIAAGAWRFNTCRIAGRGCANVRGMK